MSVGAGEEEEEDHLPVVESRQAPLLLQAPVKGAVLAPEAFPPPGHPAAIAIAPAPVAVQVPVVSVVLEKQKEPFSLQLRVYLQWPHEIRWGVLSDLWQRRQGARRVQPSTVKKDTPM